jgi:hypothetical protein
MDLHAILIQREHLVMLGTDGTAGTSASTLCFALSGGRSAAWRACSDFGPLTLARAKGKRWLANPTSLSS